MTNFAEERRFGTTGAARAAGDSTSEPGVAVAPLPGPEQIRDLLAGKFVCPFCGSINESEQGVCPRCTMENSPASRKATKSRIGPWYVLQTRNPAAPGMKFETLLNFARKAKVKPRSIVRGPTTHQLWKFAAQVKGLSREFGVCYSCGGSIEANASLCPQCNRLQDPPANPDVLLEVKDAPAVPAAAQRPSRTREPDLAEVDAEFVIPALGGTASDDSVAGVSLSGSMAGVAFDSSAVSCNETPAPSPSSSNGNGLPASFPPAARNNKRDEGFLSPRDLAAAFKLNFSPETGAADSAAMPASSDRRRAPRGPANGRDDRRQPRQKLQHPLDFQPHRPAPAIEPADVLAAPNFHEGLEEALALSRPARKQAAKPDPRPRPPRRFRFLKVFAFLVVFGGGLLAAAMYADPDLRQKARVKSFQWYSQGKAAVSQALNGSKPATEPAEPTHVTPGIPDSTNTADVRDPGASAAPVTPSDVPHPDVSAPAASDHGSDAQPASASAIGAAPPVPQPATRPAVAPPWVPRPPATPAAVTPSPVAAPAPAVVAAPAAPVVDPAAESLRLYREALKVAATDPAKALVEYKAIKKYPQECWPSDLDIRIRLAQAQLKGQQH